MKPNILFSLFVFSTIQNAAQITSDEILGFSSSPSAMFLLIPPEAVAAGFAWSGVAATTNSNAEFYNPAQTGFADGNLDFTFGYSPWLRALVNGINSINIKMRIKTSTTNTANFFYNSLSYGNIFFGVNSGKISRAERAIGLSDSYLISKHSSIGLKIKYINSNALRNSFDSVNSNLRSFHTIAFGFSYYHIHTFEVFKNIVLLNSGLSLDNIGNKIGNDSLGLQAFIPSVLRVGQSLSIDLANEHEITFQYDVYKLLTPSPPVYQTDSSGSISNNILSGHDPDRPVFNAIINSFSDAPGGFKNEVKEIHYSAGIEYGYKNLFFLRTGYSQTSSAPFNSGFYSIGGSIRYPGKYSFELSLGYLVPVAQRNPLENTLNLSIRFITL